MSFSDDAHDFYFEKHKQDEHKKGFEKGVKEGSNSGFAFGFIMGVFAMLIFLAIKK